MPSSTKSTKPVPSFLSLWGEQIVSACLILIFLLLVACTGCVQLPLAPKTQLCVFTNTFLLDDPAVVKDPKLAGQIMPPERHYFRCRNGNSTKYNISVTSPSATNIIGTPYKDYLELNAYYVKVATVMQKEVLSKVGK
jgi:hypothetical protein